jgi:hypothetical protein
VINIATLTVVKRVGVSVLGSDLIGFNVINRPIALASLEESNMEIFPLMKAAGLRETAKVALS